MSISVKNISVSIDGIPSSGFYIPLDDTKWRLDNFTLIQSLLTYNTLSFSMHKVPEESPNETKFSVCGRIIGKEITVSLETDIVEDLSFSLNQEKTAKITFHGFIYSASGTRSGTTYTVDVEARSWEALLDDNPNCKSFEEKTLNDIINDVVDEYRTRINPKISPRFTEPIAYCVQYNETNYQFLQRLARRYGEWLFNDGTKMVFSQIKELETDTIRLNYPSKDIPSYNIDLRMQPVAFNHVTSSYNAYDSTKKDGLSEMQRPYNELGDSAFEASQNCFTKQTLQNLHSGGFADEDGRETILNVSTKTQARGEKAEMLVYSGNTYCSKLKIGSTLIIVDNYISDNIFSQKSDVEQCEILITELVHSFSAEEIYSNHFVGIPSACDYPPYSNSDVYPVAPSCRAKVTDNEDPMDLGRIRVQFDWQAQLDENMMTPWLRIAQPYAGGGKGFSFIPEIGEEVMVDFEGGNAERPYIKGTLYNGMGDPDPAWVPNGNSSNQIKAIRTRNGHTIEIHDEGEDGYIRIYDNEKENYILTFSTDQKLIKLEATGNIELYAQNDIIMQAGNDMKITVGNNRSLNVGCDDSNSIGKNQSISIGESMTEGVGEDKTVTIGNNYTENVGNNSDVEIGNNAKTVVAEKHSLKANNILQVSENKTQLYSDTTEQKADSSLKIDGGMNVDIHAELVKIS